MGDVGCSLLPNPLSEEEMNTEMFLLETFRITTSNGATFILKGRCEIDVLLQVRRKGYPFIDIEKIERCIGEERWVSVPDKVLAYIKNRLREEFTEEKNTVSEN